MGDEHDANQKGWPLESCQLHVPPLDELANVLRQGLALHFAFVQVDVVDCPDLSQSPFHLTAPGLGGDPSLVDLGGVPYLVPTVHRDRIYDLADLPAAMNVKDGTVSMIGAGAGPWQHLETNCEMMTNLSLSLVAGKSSLVVDNGTRLATVDPAGRRILHVVPPKQTRCSLLNNLLVSRGLPRTPVLRIRCQKRTGPDNFVTCMRNTLRERYGDKPVGMGGVFMLENGQARLHIMPDFSPCPLQTDADVNNWLHFYNATGPLINLSVFISHDPGLDLRVEHTHCFSTHGEGGHYHEDVSPETVVYEGYFTPAERLFRIDRPSQTHCVGRD
ncbi:ester hydrolase C11orf54 homolog [Daphnia pulicaria]|uniref:ester hydrolase C11orf54 homolog n=1 Tax=Daphnia pulicaria TaxID=35523 RepID=UPI001EEC9BF5|nr:ester hydrolase C11orf54 homolog [Daphnia pulicaria]